MTSEISVFNNMSQPLPAEMPKYSRRVIFFFCAIALCGAASLGFAADTNNTNTKLETVYQDNLSQFTGVALSKTGRMFVNYPRWQGPHEYDVAEVSSNGIAQRLT